VTRKSPSSFDVAAFGGFQPSGTLRIDAPLIEDAALDLAIADLQRVALTLQLPTPNSCEPPAADRPSPLAKAAGALTLSTPCTVVTGDLPPPAFVPARRAVRESTRARRHST
jgi:hypothetical protein